MHLYACIYKLSCFINLNSILKLMSCCMFLYLYTFVNIKANDRWHKMCLFFLTIHYNTQSSGMQKIWLSFYLLNMNGEWMKLGIITRFHWAGQNGVLLNILCLSPIQNDNIEILLAYIYSLWLYFKMLHLL